MTQISGQWNAILYAFLLATLSLEAYCDVPVPTRIDEDARVTPKIGKFDIDRQ